MGRHVDIMCFGLTVEVLVVWAMLAIVLALSQPVVGQDAAGSSGASNASSSSSSSSLEYYVQVVAGAPYTGQLAPPFNSNTTYNFGAVQIFDFNITEEAASNSSKSLGHVSGYTVQTSYTATSQELEVEVVSYDDGAGVNGTLSFQGLINPSTVNEIAIVGGSGSFRGARGYVVISKINPTVYHHSLHFL